MTVLAVLVRAARMHSTDDTWEAVLESLLALGMGGATGWLMGRWRAALGKLGAVDRET
jgi:membrane protein YqaA with SNARE-associated domain